jgi:hypothetical protein
VVSPGTNATGTNDASPERVPDLEQAATRERAVGELISQFDRIAANGTRTVPARAFVSKYVSALTSAYTAGHAELSPKTRLALINLLVSFDDPQTVPAHAKAILHYAMTGDGVDEAIWACRAAQTHKDDRLRAALLSAFEHVDMSEKHGLRFGTHLRGAMLNNSTSSWSTLLIQKLRAPIARPESFNDKPAVRSFQNQLFWQTTAAELLGDLRDDSAARPLFLARLDKTKRDVHAQAEVSLIKLGRASALVAETLLTAADRELVDMSKLAEPEVKEPHIFFAADLLGKLGTPRSRDALIQAWDQTSDRVSRALLAQALNQLPPDAASLELWKKTYLTTTLDTTLPGGESALEVLAEGAPFWFNSELVPWLGQRAEAAPGKGSRKGDLQRSLVVAMGHLVTAEDAKEAYGVAQLVGGRTGTPAFEHARALATSCGNEVSCYMKHVATPEDQTGERSIIATKSAVMIGILGSNASGALLLKVAASVEDPAVQATLARAIEQLAKPGDTALVLELERAVQSAKKNKSPRADDSGPSPLELTYYRLRAR